MCDIPSNINFFSLREGVTSHPYNPLYLPLVWSYGKMVVCRSSDREVMGLSLTHCTVECGPGQATHAHVPLSPSNKTWSGGDSSRPRR